MLARLYWWLYTKVFVIAAFVILLATLAFTLKVSAQALGWFGAPPLTFTWDSQEFGLLKLVAFLLGAALVGSILYAVVTGSTLRPALTGVVAPYVLGATILVWTLWLWRSPMKDANFLPLGLLTAYAGWMTWATTWGPLSDDARTPRRVAQQRPDASRPEGEDDVALVTRPKTTFASIYGNTGIKSRLKDAAEAIIASRKSEAKPRNGILLHGGPGNGKTVFAEALAGELGLPLIQFSHAEVASQWVGEKTARVRQAFEQAKRAQPCVLFIDEVESFLEARNGRNDGVKEDRDVTNALLTLMVEIRKHRVILMAATNHMDSLDGAAVREGRFDYKVEITPPDAEARLGLLAKGLRDNLPGSQVDEDVVKAVANRWNGFSVKRILAVTEELPAYMKGQGGRTRIEFEDFMGALRQLQGQRGAKPENVKPLSELLLAPDTREALDLITGRMADPEHTEKFGGTLPTGVLFSGPPGTGKTATAKALAAEIGWAFLPSTGAELARDPKKLEGLYSKAKDLRPTIIFIDEADELLRSREFSGSTEATNKLLTLMDGVGDRVRDVVWIAATNHPDSIDSALLRGGRFTEKVRFELPDESAMAMFVSNWIASRKVNLATDFTPARAAEMLGVQSIANAEAALQAALNRAISRRSTPVVVGEADLAQAVRTVFSDA